MRDREKHGPLKGYFLIGSKLVKANKTHVCNVCGVAIIPGDTYIGMCGSLTVMTPKGGGPYKTAKMHTMCSWATTHDSRDEYYEDINKRGYSEIIP